MFLSINKGFVLYPVKYDGPYVYICSQFNTLMFTLICVGDESKY